MDLGSHGNFLDNSPRRSTAILVSWAITCAIREKSVVIHRLDIGHIKKRASTAPFESVINDLLRMNGG